MNTFPRSPTRGWPTACHSGKAGDRRGSVHGGQSMRRQLFSDTDRKQSQQAGARGSGRACVSPSKALLPSDLLLSARSRLLKVLQPSRQRYKTGPGCSQPELGRGRRFRAKPMALRACQGHHLTGSSRGHWCSLTQ